MDAPRAARKSKYRKEASRGRPLFQKTETSCLEEKESLLRGLFDLSAEGVFLVQAGRIVECNRFLAEKAGYAVEEVAGSIFASFFDTESMGKVESALAPDACPAPDGAGFSARIVCKNGDAFTARFRSLPCAIGGRPASLVVLSDSGRPTPPAEAAFDWQAGFFPEEPPARLPGPSTLSSKNTAPPTA
ncbi:MAG: PAS domain S-box protein [Desulfobacterales bacterium]